MAVNSFNAQNPPVTTKGDVFTFSTIPTRLGVGANDTVLTADSTTATGLKWATPSSGGLTLLSTTTLSGASTTISSISGSYKNLIMVIDGLADNSTGDSVYIRFNGDSGTKYYWGGYYSQDNNGTLTLNNYNGGRAGATSTRLSYAIGTGDNNKNKCRGTLYLYRYTTTGGVFYDMSANVQNSNTYSGTTRVAGMYDNSAAITSITIGLLSGSITAGTAYLYGEN